MRGQRLAGRDADAQPVGAGAFADVLVRQQRGEERRHAVEDRRADAAHRSRTQPPAIGRCGHSTAVAPTDSGNDHGVAEPIGEEQLRRGKHHIVVADAENALPHQPCGRHQAGMDVPDALGIAGRARRIEPERDFVGQRVGRVRRCIGASERSSNECTSHAVESGHVFGARRRR